MAPKLDAFPTELTEYIAEDLITMENHSKPKGGYKSPLLNFRATNTVIEAKVQRVFALRYLYCCQFPINEPSILVLEQIAKKVGLGDHIVFLELGDFMNKPTMHLNERHAVALVKSLKALKRLD